MTVRVIDENHLGLFPGLQRNLGHILYLATRYWKLCRTRLLPFQLGFGIGLLSWSAFAVKLRKPHIQRSLDSGHTDPDFSANGFRRFEVLLNRAMRLD